MSIGSQAVPRPPLDSIKILAFAAVALVALVFYREFKPLSYRIEPATPAPSIVRPRPLDVVCPNCRCPFRVGDLPDIGQLGDLPKAAK